MEIIYHVHRAIGDVFSKAWGGIPTPIGNSHGWQPPTEDPAAIMQMLDEAVRSCGYQDKVAYALDCAASEMYDETTKTYYLNGTTVDRDGQIAYVKKLTEQYPFLFVEDVLDENDWDGLPDRDKGAHPYAAHRRRSDGHKSRAAQAGA